MKYEKLQDTECVVIVCWNFLRQFFIILKMLKNVNNIYIYMDCLFPKKENKESKTDWLAERRNIRMYNARLVLL